MKKFKFKLFFLLLIFSLISCEKPKETYSIVENEDEVYNQENINGVGLILSKKSNNDYPKVEEIIKESPALLSKKIFKGDMIIGVFQFNSRELIDFKSLPLEQVTQTLRGKPNSQIQILIKKPNNKTLLIPIQRKTLKFP